MAVGRWAQGWGPRKPPSGLGPRTLRRGRGEGAGRRADSAGLWAPV